MRILNNSFPRYHLQSWKLFMSHPVLESLHYKLCMKISISPLKKHFLKLLIQPPPSLRQSEGKWPFATPSSLDKCNVKTTFSVHRQTSYSATCCAQNQTEVITFHRNYANEIQKKIYYYALERNHTDKRKGNPVSSKIYSDGQENLQNIFKAWELRSSTLCLWTVPAASRGLSPPHHWAV